LESNVINSAQDDIKGCDSSLPPIATHVARYSSKMAEKQAVLRETSESGDDKALFFSSWKNDIDRGLMYVLG
jgi:hypothetical protein